MSSCLPGSLVGFPNRFPVAEFAELYKSGYLDNIIYMNDLTEYPLHWIYYP